MKSEKEIRDKLSYNQECYSKSLEKHGKKFENLPLGFINALKWILEE